MFITKADPDVSKDGKIKNGIIIKKGVLTIERETEGRLSYKNGGWYVLGADGKEYYQGVGANPCYETTNEDILDQNLFDNVFEQVEE